MAAVAELKGPELAAGREQKPGVVLLVGRLSAVRKAGENMLHLMVMPAPDEYSSPSTVEIIAKRRMGDVGEGLRLLCRVGGFARRYKSTDQDTGEIRQVTTADNKFYVIEDR